MCLATHKPYIQKYNGNMSLIDLSFSSILDTCLVSIVQSSVSFCRQCKLWEIHVMSLFMGWENRGELNKVGDFLLAWPGFSFTMVLFSSFLWRGISKHFSVCVCVCVCMCVCVCLCVCVSVSVNGCSCRGLSTCFTAVNSASSFELSTSVSVIVCTRVL